MNNVHHTKETVLTEIWDNVGEQLEMLPYNQWHETLVPLLTQLLAKEKNNSEYLKIRLNHVQTSQLN